MKVAYITPELFPYSKTGGLADVAKALPSVLKTMGIETTVFTPLHSSAADWLAKHATAVEKIELPQQLQIGDQQVGLSFISISQSDVRTVFVVNDGFFDRTHPYLDENGEDYPDNVARYSFFCRAILEYWLHTGEIPEICHCNDWQSALLPAYLAKKYHRPDLEAVRTLLTIHNLGYQGLFPAEHLESTGLGWDFYNIDGFEFYGKLNMLKGGMVFANALSTVSPSYAAEIQTEEYGCGLHGVLKAHAHKLKGILNGIDDDQWDPATDPLIPATYSVGNLKGKVECKKELQRRLGLQFRAGAMLMGVVSRFDNQKGIELIMQAFPNLAMLDLQLVILGEGDAVLEHSLRGLAVDYPEQVAVHIGFDERLAHLIEAGSDAFLMPSLYEPCGLNQMYSQRYGTVPIIRETGGLKDTVTNLTEKRLQAGRASGFTFRTYDAQKLADTIRRAAKVFHTERMVWNKLVRTIMQRDYSWKRSAKSYIRLYRSLVHRSITAAGDVDAG